MVTKTTLTISDATLVLLENFSDLNDQILIRPGNEIYTINTSQSAFVYAKVEENFPTKFALHSIKEFIKTLKLFNKQPEIAFDNYCMYLTDTDTNTKVRYVYAGEKTLKENERFNIEELAEVPDLALKISVNSNVIKDIKRAVRVLGASHISINLENDECKLRVENMHNKNYYELDMTYKAFDLEKMYAKFEVQQFFVLDGVDYDLNFYGDGGFGEFKAKPFKVGETPVSELYYRMTCETAE